MTGLIERMLRRLDGQLPGRISKPGDNRYVAATALWAKPIGRMPRAVAHCRTPQDVQSAIRAARDCDLPLSVRGGGHDWAGRALCDGLVIDLSGMNEVVVGTDGRTARISGGARAADVVAMTDPLGLVAVTGSVGAVGMAGLTLGGGYGPLIGRFGLALDNLLAADVVLADGRIVTVKHDSEEDLFWALHGGGGNFGVVTAMRQTRSRPLLKLGTDVVRRAGPGRRRHDEHHGCTVRAGNQSELDRQFLGHGSAEVDAALEDPFGFRERVDEHA